MIGSLCTGYGGLDLAVELVTGRPTAWVCENDPDPSAILARRFPGVPNHGDLTSVAWADVAPVEILTAGYPCQPFSQAGKRKGTTDDRHLWPSIAAAVRLLRPRVVVLENVAGHLQLGFGDVLGDLASLGYDARWICVRASDAGAPHRRLRLFVAATDTGGEAVGVWPGLREGWETGVRRGRSDYGGASGPAPDPGRHGREGRPERHGPQGDFIEASLWDNPDGRASSPSEWGPYADAIHRWERILARPAPRATEPGRGGADRLSPRFVEWMMGLPDGWVTDTGISRPAQLKALGNGVVPQQAALALTLLGLTTSAAVA